jgi:hypothetical protein
MSRLQNMTNHFFTGALARRQEYQDRQVTTNSPGLVTAILVIMTDTFATIQYAEKMARDRCSTLNGRTALTTRREWTKSWVCIRPVASIPHGNVVSIDSVSSYSIIHRWSSDSAGYVLVESEGVGGDRIKFSNNGERIQFLGDGGAQIQFIRNDETISGYSIMRVFSDFWMESAATTLLFPSMEGQW